MRTWKEWLARRRVIRGARREVRRYTKMVAGLRDKLDRFPKEQQRFEEICRASGATLRDLEDNAEFWSKRSPEMFRRAQRDLLIHRFYHQRNLKRRKDYGRLIPKVRKTLERKTQRLVDRQQDWERARW